MVTVLLVLSLITVGIGGSFGDKSDPDVDICITPDFDGGFVDYDGTTYLFKDTFFWSTNDLSREKGFKTFADLTINKWPEVQSNIQTVFTVLNNDAFVTVFVVKNKWISYLNSSKLSEGSTDMWPMFNSLNIDVVFSARSTFLDPNKTQVFALHSKSNHYILYDFKDVSKPEILRAEVTSVSKFNLRFLEDSPISSNRTKEDNILGNLLNVRVGLNYNNKLVLLSKTHFCVVNLVSTTHQKECLPKPVNQVLNCPLDISKRPNSAMATDSHAITGTNNNSKPVQISSVRVVRFAQTTFEGRSSGDEPDINNDNGPVKTSIPILGREWIDEDNETRGAQGNSRTSDEDSLNDREKSDFWVIVFLVGLVVFAISSMVLVAMISVFQKKRPKGEVIYTSLNSKTGSGGVQSGPGSDPSTRPPSGQSSRPPSGSKIDSKIGSKSVSKIDQSQLG